MNLLTTSLFSLICLTFSKTNKNVIDYHNMDPYKVLNIAKGATFDQITVRYKKLIQIHQPELGGDPKIFNQIKYAYSLIEDEWIDKAYQESMKGENLEQKKYTSPSSRSKKGLLFHELFPMLSSIVALVAAWGGVLFIIWLCSILVDPQRYRDQATRAQIQNQINQNYWNDADYERTVFNQAYDYGRQNRQEREPLRFEEIPFLNHLILELIDRINAPPEPASANFIASLRPINYSQRYSEESCSICMAKFGEDPYIQITKTPCSHVFHKQCLVTWLQTTGTCPNCRVVFPREVEETEDFPQEVEETEDEEGFEEFDEEERIVEHFCPSLNRTVLSHCAHFCHVCRQEVEESFDIN